MNDDALGAAWTTLSPTSARRRHIDARVFAWLEAADTPLATEWLRLFNMHPFTAIGLVTVSAVFIVAATPLGWLAQVLM